MLLGNGFTALLLFLLFLRCALLFYLIGDKIPRAARNSSEVARDQSKRCYLITGNGGLR